MSVSPVLAKVLAAGRPQFNQRVVEARHRVPTFDAAAFAEFLASGVNAVALAVDWVAPERVSQAVVVAYDIALDLVSQGLAGPGARTQAVNRVWTELVPTCARAIAEQPQAVLGALTNAVLHLEKFPGARVDPWRIAMTEFAPQTRSVPQLLALGQVLAWRSGLAHFRAGALRAAGELPEDLAIRVLGAEGPLPIVLDMFRRDPWWMPFESQRDRITRRHEVGRFAGFGGTFLEPPEVRACAEGFLVRSGERFSLLVADSFGAVFHSANAEEFAQAANGPLLGARLRDTTLVLPAGEVALDLPATGLSVASNDHTIAVTSPWTFAIRLVPRG